MNRGAFIFLGVFALLALSWALLINKPQAESGNLSPILNDDGTQIPAVLPGLAQQGRKVYQELGCINCHTQQVRYYGGRDIERGWGERATIGQDYVGQYPVLIGYIRHGQDLTNVGDRRPDAAWHHQHFYNSQITSPGSNMPSYAFLYQTREIKGESSARALDLPAEYAPKEGYEVIPTRDAEALVAYMTSLKINYDLELAPSYKKMQYVAPEDGAAAEVSQ